MSTGSPNDQKLTSQPVEISDGKLQPAEKPTVPENSTPQLTPVSQNTESLVKPADTSPAAPPSADDLSKTETAEGQLKAASETTEGEKEKAKEVEVPAPTDAVTQKQLAERAEHLATEQETLIQAALASTNLYEFSIAGNDIHRLVAQSRLWSSRVIRDAPRYIKHTVTSILDLGCGTGFITMTLARLYPKAKVVGIDTSEAALAEARKLASNQGVTNVEFILGNITEDLPDGPFDLIFCSVVLLYVRDKYRLILEKAYDKLTPGGTVWLRELQDSPEKPTIKHPTYSHKYLPLAIKAFNMMDAVVDVGDRLIGTLEDIGFVNVRGYEETYNLSMESADRQIALSVILGGMLNMHVMVANILEMPPAEIRAMYDELTKDVLNLKGTWTFPVVVANKPHTSIKQEQL